MVVQKLQKIFAFFLLETDDISRELWVDVQGFLAGSRMCTNERVDGSVAVSEMVPVDLPTTTRLTKLDSVAQYHSCSLLHWPAHTLNAQPAGLRAAHGKQAKVAHKL
jgi:hypothetical protein